MATIYGTFKNIHDDTIEVTITSSLGDTDIEIGGVDSGVHFTDNPIEIKMECDDLFETIIKKSCTINLLTKQYLGDILFSGKETDVKVKVKKNGIVIFSGFVEPNTYSQSYAYEWEEFTLNCIDYLSTLQYKYLTDEKTYESWLEDSNIYTFRNLVGKIINNYGSVMYDNSKTVSGESAFDVCGIPINVFLGDSADDVDSYEDVLTEILQYLNLHIIQEGENFYIFDWKSIEDGEITWSCMWGSLNQLSPSSKVVGKDDYSSDSTSLSMSDVYNQIQVKCRLEDIDEILKSPLDTELIQSHYDRSQLFMTEYWTTATDGDAHGAFLSAINSEAANDPESTDFGTDNSTWNARDWYVKNIYNPNWKLRYKNTDIEALTTTVSGDTYLDQWKVMKALRENKFFPALVTISKQKSPMTYKNKKRTTQSLDSTNYLVISVNGNEIDSDAEATKIDKANLEASGDGLFTYTSSNSGSFSPQSDNITNYLVFSGKIALGRLQYKSGVYGIFSGGEIESSPDLTFKNVTDAKVIKFYYQVDYGNDKAIYAQEFWEAANPTDKPTKAADKLYMYPFINSTSNGQYQYNYSSEGSQEDKYDKLPILECQMKIGDKYLVEDTYDLRGKKPTYSWLTLDECPYLKDDEGNWTDVKKTTFTLGFDPELEDFIIGKEYELANTVDGRVSDEVGTAIPITIEDALAGNIEFKIIGVVNTTWNDITRRHPTMFRHTKWTTNAINVLSHVSAIWISDFNIKIISDNAGKDVAEQSKDLIYSSNEVDSYIKKKDDIEFKINTIPTVDEAVELGIKSTISNTNVVNTKTNLPLRDELTFNGETNRAEKLFIEEYWNYYNKPKVILETEIHDNGYNIFNTFTFSGFGKMLTQGITKNVKKNTIELQARQL